MTSPEATPTPVTAAASSRALAPVYVAHALLHLQLTLFPAVLFILRGEFSQSYAMLGGVYGIALLLYGLGSLPVGLLVDHVRPVRLLQVSALGSSIACLAMALAPGAGWFAAALICLGAACSIHHPAALTLIARAGHSRPQLFGDWGMLGSAGLAITPAFGGLLAAAGSWRTPFAAAAGLGGLVVVALLTATRRYHDAASDVVVTDHEAQQTHAPSLGLVFVIGVAMAFVYTGFVTFLPAFTGTRMAFLPASTVVRGGVVASVVYAIGSAGQWWAGRVGHHAGLERRYTWLLGLNAVLLLAAVPTGDWALLAVLCAFSFVHFATQPLDNVLISKFSAPQARGRFYALSCVLSFGVGALGAWAGGLVADAAGGRLQYVFLMLAVVAALATAAGFALQSSARAAARRG